MNSQRETLVFRLLKEDDKDARLRAAVRSLRNGSDEAFTHRVAQGTFRLIPGAPFAYWVSDAMREKFKEFPRLEGTAATVRVGLQTSDDFRFVRAAWEVPPALIGQSREDTDGSRQWIPFAKGGEFAPYYSDLYLVVQWGEDGLEMKAWADPLYDNSGWSRIIKSTEFYFRPGLTWPLRAAIFSPQVRATGSIFSVRGSSMFADSGDDLLWLLGLTSSRLFDFLFKMLLGRFGFPEFVVGVLQQLPAPPHATTSELGQLARSIHDLKRSLDTASEKSHVFILPALLQHSGPTLAARLAKWNAGVVDAATRIVAAQREVDEICYRLYGISAEDRATVEAELGTEVRGLPEPILGEQAAADFVSWMVGVVLGRFDVRLTTGERSRPELPDPFAALPAFSPGMLPDGRLPSGYPLAVDDDGILVDYEGHSDDVVGRIRTVLHLLWPDQADEIEKEACALLGVKSLRGYFEKTGKGGYWNDHLRDYSKGPRRAPIYWLLQSPRGLYRTWIYAHHMTRDTLPKLLGARYLGGALAEVKHGIEDLRPAGQTKPNLTKKQERRLAQLDDLLVDLEELAAMLRAVVGRANDRGETVGYAPDLSDGVVLAAAPLHGLIPWPKTLKRGGKTVGELQAYWEELEQGEYDWAHVAMLYWPTRVTEKCRRDKSLALAHGLDAEFFPCLRDELRRQPEAPVDSIEESENNAEDDPGEDVESTA